MAGRENRSGRCRVHGRGARCGPTHPGRGAPPRKLGSNGSGIGVIGLGLVTGLALGTFGEYRDPPKGVIASEDWWGGQGDGSARTRSTGSACPPFYSAGSEKGRHGAVAPLHTLRFPNYALRTPSAAGKITRSSVRQ